MASSTSSSLAQPLMLDVEPEDGSVKIDHKVWFSAERTTIQWLKMGIEVGGVGLAPGHIHRQSCRPLAGR